jgi:hypothetical protein
MKPYVTISFANRNDNYGGFLAERIQLFIDYYAHFVKQWPDVFEFVIIDYNPPSDKPKLRDAFNWDVLGHVIHCEVSPEVHMAIPGASIRKIQDYIARNIGLRYGTAPFAMVLNQDIFISSSILEEISKKRLSPFHFYRADRCDFNLDPCKGKPAPKFEQLAAQHTFVVHRRHASNYQEISVDVTPDTLTASGSVPEPGDTIDPNINIIYCTAARTRQHEDHIRYAGKPMNAQAEPREQRYHYHQYYIAVCMHTNASGDFVLASKEAWQKIHGFPEDPSFYMQTDAYGVFQLFSAGYDQAIFMQPHRIFHADHDRSGRAGFVEPEYIVHETRFNDIIKGKASFCFNDAQWGLSQYALKFWNHPQPETLPKNFMIEGQA